MKLFRLALILCCPVLLGGAAAPSPTSERVSATDFCGLYGFSGKPVAAESCLNAPRGRVITCTAGYDVVGTVSPSIMLPGVASFSGCTLVNTCTAYGYSGAPANTLSCVATVNRRTITCEAGYYAVAPATPSVTLAGAAPFAGCTAIDTCRVYGYSGAPAYALSCASAINRRTITCQEGYFATPPDKRFVTLTGASAFAGCTPFTHR
jgi:hypothetical protein